MKTEKRKVETIRKVHYLQETQRPNIKYKHKHIQESVLYVIEVNNDLTREESSWNMILREVDNYQNIENSIELYINEIKKRNLKEIKNEYTFFLNQISNTYKEYQLEKSEKKLNKFHEVSENSFFQLIRFIPEFPKENLDIYVDEKTGCFGVIIRPKIKEKPLLNLLMQDNKEIIFSYIKRRKKIIKISGRAYFNDEYEDSCEIKRLIRMISE